ncbi:TPA: hypothetical protein DIS56_00220 [Candidatus Saccharibacteria bacterium]|nr:MAG: hypothetical protein A3F05_02890 [Candidatus Saccharibacteria bacterium RIFCSPHIGHO2_12_FULL_47_17]HCM51554.1 hypothetical protein [Candidatus Saccharibacteria bacterium]
MEVKMRTAEQQLKDWSETFANPPKLSQYDSWLTSLLAVVFLAMAILQVASFNDFKSALGGLGIANSPETWAFILVVAEVWAALGFLKVRLHGLIRFFSGVFAVFAAGFWFVESLQVVAGTTAGQLANNGFFGKYLTQQPGWWTVLEASVLLFWVVYSLRLSKR